MAYPPINSAAANGLRRPLGKAQFGLGRKTTEVGFTRTKRCVINLLLAFLVLLQGLPLTAMAYKARKPYVLPTAHVGEPYNLSLEAVLRETYRLRLVQEGSSLPNFNWSTPTGGLPPGLTLTPDGLITGQPTEHRTQPYVFQVKVFDMAMANAEPTEIAFSLTTTIARPRLVSINSPKLVAIKQYDLRANHPTAVERSTSAETNNESDRASSMTSQPDGSEQGQAGSPNTSQTIKAGPRSGISIDDRFSSFTSITTAGGFAAPPTAPCTLPTEFQPPTGADVITVDVPTRTARFPTASDGSGPTVNLADQLEFKRGTVVRIVFDNKNPYLYQSKYTRESKLVTEQAIAAFLPAIGGVISDFLKAPAKEEAKAAPTTAPAPGSVPASDPCADARAAVKDLDQDVKRLATQAQTIESNLAGIKAAAEALAKTYQDDRNALYVFGKKRPELYCDSKKLLSDTDNGIGDANTKALAAIQKEIRLIKTLADAVPARVKFITTTFDPKCLDMQLLFDDLVYAKGLLTFADGYQKTVDDIKATTDKVEAGREAVAGVLRDPSNFFEVQTEGGGSATKIVDGKLTLTPQKDVKEATAVDPITISMKFGGAPFFSLSGGLMFSPLRKREYVRVQGFERDAQGNLVLTNGKPNLTTVIGLKENSPTRIVPIVFLNGRLKDFANPYIDAVHISLGITAKNDNKGTDMEFLVGPSFSMFERNMFFTFGGFAGRQQKLSGGLFEGFAVPSTVDELPIQKNYHWSVGFALSYKLPLNK